MKKSICTWLVAAFLVSFSLVFLAACSGSHSGSGVQYDSRQYYDQYVDRPGYYDFNRPVIFVPGEKQGL